MKEYNQKLQKKKIYIGIMIGLTLLVMLLMPVWYIRTVEVMNNVHYTKEEIIETSQIEDTHILDLSFKSAQTKLLKLPYIKEVHISYRFPGKVTIDVVESAPFVYVQFMGSYLCLNEQGQVIEQTSGLNNNVPIVQGLKADSFKIGEMLPIQNEDTWFYIKDIMDALKKMDYVEKIGTIDVHNLEEIHLYVDNLDVIMGDIGDFDKKLRWLVRVHEIYDMGILDLSNVIKNGQAPLRPIT